MINLHHTHTHKQNEISLIDWKPNQNHQQQHPISNSFKANHHHHHHRKLFMCFFRVCRLPPPSSLLD